MFDKLLVRVKTWLGSDLDENASSGRATPGRPSTAETKDGLPPVPTQARDDRDSSGSIRLSDSGIIILDNEPEAPPPRAKTGTPLPQGVPEKAAWALPTLPKPGTPEAARASTVPAKPPSDSGFDWDEVLARARAKAAARAKPSDPK